MGLISSLCVECFVFVKGASNVFVIVAKCCFPCIVAFAVDTDQSVVIFCFYTFCFSFLKALIGFFCFFNLCYLCMAWNFSVLQEKTG